MTVNPARRHPNALVALISSLGLGSLIVQFGSNIGINLSVEQATAVAGGIATVALFIGHNGIVGTWNAVKGVVLHGTGGKPAAKPKP